MVITPQMVREVIRDAFRPRSICICANPKPDLWFDLYDFCTCGHCGADISMQRLLDLNLQLGGST